MTKWKGEVASYAPSGSALFLSLSLAAGLAAGSAAAADRYWDPNGTTLNRGGTGTWNVASPFWSPSGDGVSGPYSAWSNAALDNAIFGGTAGTVTLGVPISAHNLTFETTGYVLSGSTLTLGGVTPTITTNAGVAATINSILAGSNGLAKTGAGQVLLTGINSFSGTINVIGGTLAVNGDAALGAAGNSVTLAGGAGFNSSGALGSNRLVTLLGSGQSVISGAGVGSARFTGAGGISAGGSVSLINNANDYKGPTTLAGGGTLVFTSIANLNMASALGAPTDATSGLISLGVGNTTSARATYTGGAAASDRNWRMGSWFYETSTIANQGTGTLTLTGDIYNNHTNSSIGPRSIVFSAVSADLELLGTIASSNAGVGAIFNGGGTNRSITVTGVNTFGGIATVQGVTVKANSLKNTGTASALGTGSNGGISIGGGTLAYTGAGDSSNRGFALDGNAILANDGTGALALSGAFAFAAGGAAADTLTLGGNFAGTNILSGVMSGKGNLVSAGSGTWQLNGANAYAGTVTVESGRLVAGSTQAFGTTPNAATVNGGALDLNGFDTSFTSLAGSGGSVALGGAQLTVKGTTSTIYGGSITGAGGLLKQGTSTLTLSGASTYSGATTVNGGGLVLDFTSPGAPLADIVSSASTLNMAGGTLTLFGGSGQANVQTFNGLNVTAGNNKISAQASAAGSVTVNLGAINRTGGLIDFTLPASGNFTTSNTVLGGWATVNGADYAKVVGGNITAFTAADYTGQDDASLWAAGQYVTDDDGHAGSFYNTVNGSVQLGGLRYTQVGASMATIGAGQTLGIDGAIIVAATAGTFDRTLNGGAITGSAGGGVLGLLHNAGGTFAIDSTIVDNGGATGFTKAGTGTARLGGANTYSGVTTLSGGTLQITSLANAGVASSIGTAAADPRNLVLESGTLAYVGGTDTATDRGFTLVNGGAGAPVIDVNAGRTIGFSGKVTSPDDAGLTKTGLGTLVLANAANDYVGVTTITGSSGGQASTISVNTLANGGIASGIGAASSASANLVLSQGGRLQYTGGTVAIDRGFTLGAGGGRIDVAQASTTLTVNGAVVGAGSLTKDGDGSLLLSGPNTYAGDTIVNGGTLRAGSAQAFGTTAFMTVNAAARLELGGYDTTVSGLLGAGTVDLGGNTLISSAGSANGFSGRITGTGGFTRTGNWTQTLSGCANDYTGKTTIGGGGSLAVDCLANGGVASGIGASSAASANLVFADGVLAYSGGSVTTDRGFTLQSGVGTLNVSNAATTLDFTGQVVGGGSLQKTGAGTLVLSGVNTYTGTTFVRAGTLRANSSRAFGGAGPILLDNAAGVTLDLAGYDTSMSYLELGGALGGNVDLGGATLTIAAGNNSATSYFAGAINGTGRLVKNGTGTQKLRGCNSTYTGSTTINGGLLMVTCLDNGGVASSIGLSSADAANLVINGGTLRYAGAGGSTDRRFTLGASAGNTLDASGTGAIDFTSTAPVTFAVANAAQTLTLTGTSTDNNKLGTQLTNNGTGVTSLVKTGDGTWILTNPASTYTGVTTISGGVLGVDKLTNGGLASSLGASSAAASNLIIGNGSTLRYTGAGDSTNRLFTLSAGVTFIESSGTGAIVFTDIGPVNLAGANQARTIALGGTNTGNNTLAGSIGDAGTGKTILAKNDSGTWVLTGNNTFSGNTVVNAGRLVLGNGGTTGSVTSDIIVDGGSFAFNRSDSYGYAGVISGNGGIDQIGSGITTLTGANSYKGATNVNAGTLLLNGNQAAANGPTNVNSAAVLGGTGIVGGNVIVAGGTLSPGSNGAGTLTINGNLTLDAASKLAMQFGQAGTTGGALNDLIDVKGDLTLAGTLNVSETVGGSFGPGIYRIISYSGNFTDNGLNVGTLPSGTGIIQTSVAGQVNLLAGGNNFSFWDGDAGPKFNGVVNGGNGAWQNSTGNNNWAETTGNVNAAYADGTFAVFAGAAGTVTVDNSLGAVTASGMQFATGGYVISGNPLALVGPQSTIRVGDGTAAGAGMTATIASILSGSTQLVKTDAGTLVLTGANTYTGGTLVEGGTLRIAADANLGAAAGGLGFSGGTLNTTATFATGRAVTLSGAGTVATDTGTILTLSGPVTGGGALTKGGTGTLILTGNASHGGGTTIATGTLQVGAGGTSGSITGNIVDNGALVFSRSDGLLYAGAISGSGSLTKNGAGTLTMTGASTFTGATAVNAGTLELRSAGQISATASLSVANGGQVIVDGTGSRLITGSAASVIGVNGSAVLTVSNGGLASFGGQATMASGSGSSATLNITGPGSQVTQSGIITVGLTGTAAVNILGGGKMISSGASALVGGQFPTAATGVVNVSGTGSRWDVANALHLRRGSVTVANGGVVSAASAVVGFTGTGINNPNADLIVTGPGSRFETNGVLAITNSNANSARGSVTIADGGTVKAGGGLLAMGPGDAVLNIGGVAGGAAAHAGFLEATAVTFGAVGNRINFNHDDSAYLFQAAISGGGSINHNGPGATMLAGANAYTGATTVNAGSLYINGNQSAATGLVTVNSGATLGGKGNIGGDVVIANGGTVNPGDLGIAPGTLAIAGDLTLNGGSTLNFSLGQANVPGGPLNDLIEVGGDLVLAGTLNVTTSGGGSFDPGIYRVLNYAGSLTNNGLTTGAMPSPDFYVQTSINHQVNLVNTAGMALRYWDGDAGPKNNGTIEGGNGSWQAFGIAPGIGNDNWTEDGAANAPFEDAAFAVFMGAAGAITVDDSKGAVNASGMQFMTDGYVVDGDAINLVGAPASVVRVGDGTTAGAGTTATIRSALNGASQLVKSDMGTLILAGSNGYGGGTAIHGGVLQVAADNNLGAVSGGLSFNGGALQTTTSFATNRDVTFVGAGTLLTDTGTTLTLNGAVAGAGMLTKDGAGSLLLLRDAAHVGGTTITQGTLQLGNGGTTGGLAGDVVNNGLLVVDRSNTLKLGGRITGGGAFTQQGTGTTVLSGNNGYLGATTVGAGRLLVNGDQSAATGATTVASGATLGGAGIVGGNASVADGAVLDPGSMAGAASTLTIKGHLSLAGGSKLNMQFGEANIAGGAFNDLIEVGGNLTLAGTLDVSVAPGGMFGAGIYRVINYAGALTNNGLALGAMPADSKLFLQTSVAGQVNLVNHAGLTLNYWDGEAGPKFDHGIAGGDGRWQSSLGNDNWTDAGGDINAPYTNGSYAIFTGAAGTVSVDNSLGQVAATGMQFAVDGYHVEGGDLALTGAQAVIRVGDGTAAGTGMTATIASALTGSSQLVKSDSGTLALAGVNSYSGGTSLLGGTVQVAADSALGDSSGRISFGGGTLRTTSNMTSGRALDFAGAGTLSTDAGTSLTLNGVLSGTGGFTKTGTGVLTLTADSGGYGGIGTVGVGTLVVTGTAGGNWIVDKNARLEGTGRIGPVSNAGTIAPGGFGSLTIQGDYTGNAGRLEIATALGGDSSQTGRLVIAGASAGDTQITVTNRGGLGGQTVEGIKIVDVGGASHGTFALAGDYVFDGQQAVIGGAYGYRLYKGGVAMPNDGDWYLRSALLDPQKPEEPGQPLYQPGVPVYESYAGALQQFNKAATLQQRVGNRVWNPRAGTERQANPDDGVWARIEAAHSKIDSGVSTSQSTYDAEVWKFQTGVEGVLHENAAGRFVGGVFASYGTLSSAVRSPYGFGGIKADAYGVGATLTWYGGNGFYADALAQVTWYDSDLNSATARRELANGNNATGYNLSIEAGQRFDLGAGWSLTPQVQLAYSSVNFSDFTDVFGAHVSLDGSRSLMGRVGVVTNYDFEWHQSNGDVGQARLYGIANLYHEFSGASKVDVSGVSFAARGDRVFGSIGVGGSLGWGGDKYSLYGEARLGSSLKSVGDSRTVGGTLGFRMNW